MLGLGATTGAPGGGPEEGLGGELFGLRATTPEQWGLPGGGGGGAPLLNAGACLEEEEEEHGHLDLE